MLILSAVVATAALAVMFLRSPAQVPVIDIAPLLTADASQVDVAKVVDQIALACHKLGFFYIANTGVPAELTGRIEEAARDFFALPEEEKRQISMDKGGKAWRGYFAVGEELTSGRADQKQGIYFGSEGNANDPRPLFGLNQWPAGAIGEQLKVDVTDYMKHMKRVGTTIVQAIGEGLYQKSPEGDDGYQAFIAAYAEPTELFRIFGYPAPEPTAKPSSGANAFGVAEHTDYGAITILHQDVVGGLQVRGLGLMARWLDVSPKEGTFVVNVGDALEHHTDGYVRASAHRVLFTRSAEHKGRQRISFPYFFDPNMESVMKKMTFHPGVNKAGKQRMHKRWDGKDLSHFNGRYGDYFKAKISQVFPALFDTEIAAAVATGGDVGVGGGADTAPVASAAAAAAAASTAAAPGADATAEHKQEEEEERKNGETKAEFDRRKQIEVDEVFEWTARVHKAKGELSGEEASEEEALRARLEAWNAQHEGEAATTV